MNICRPNSLLQTLQPDALQPAREAISRAIAIETQLRAWSHIENANDLVQPSKGPLQGWPLGVKDILDVAGMPTRCGSSLSSPTVKAFDSSCVAQLRAAGAVPIGKTVTAEYAYVTPGPTRNPWDAEHTPGGSSSGSAAAVAAGIVHIALGTQTGGSMIRPAALCGGVGFKPTRGMVSRAGMQLTCESLDVIGWFASSVARARSVGQVLLPSRQISERPLSKLRVALINENPGHVMEPEAAEALSAAALSLRNCGVQLHQVGALAVAKELLDIHSILMLYEISRSLQAQVDADHRQLSPQLLDAIRRGRSIGGNDYLIARASQNRFQNCWEAMFGEADLVLTSSALGTAPKSLQHTGDSAFNKGWSVLGWPCLHLPTTLSSSGLPLGVLLVAKPCSDLDMLDWANDIHPAIDVRQCAIPSIHYRQVESYL